MTQHPAEAKKKEKKVMSCMYNMPPPWMIPGYGYPPQVPTPSPDIWDKAMKWVEKQERKKQKAEEKKKDGGKKPDGFSPFQMFIFLTAITPFVGPATVWAWAFMLRQAVQNLQVIVPH